MLTKRQRVLISRSKMIIQDGGITWGNRKAQQEKEQELINQIVKLKKEGAAEKIDSFNVLMRVLSL